MRCCHNDAIPTIHPTKKIQVEKITWYSGREPKLVTETESAAVSTHDSNTVDLFHACAVRYSTREPIGVTQPLELYLA